MYFSKTNEKGLETNSRCMVKPLSDYLGFFTEQEKVFLKRFVEKNRKLIKLVPKEFNLAELSFYVVQRELDSIAIVYYGSGFVVTVLFVHTFIFQFVKTHSLCYNAAQFDLVQDRGKKLNSSQQVAALTCNLTPEVYLHF